MADENIIEINRNDYIVEIEDVQYEICVGTLVGNDYEHLYNRPKINSMELIGNKTSSDLFLASAESLLLKEDLANKVTSIDLNSTDAQYASAKCVYDNLAAKANISDLAAVATSGSYNDLSNKPTIPTVNDATLTIQKNGTNVSTFTANASSNVTANITVPTDVSELTNTSLANNDLSNLGAGGENRLHALKAYADNGELLTDAKGLENVKNYAHSTFDRSKFTVVGSPVITDDGVASGFSGSNYITKSSIDLRNMNSFKLDIDFTISSTRHTKSREIFQLYYGTNEEALAIFQHTNDNRIFLCYPTSDSASDNAVIGAALSVGKHSLTLDYDGTNAYIYVDGTLKLTQAITKAYLQKLYTLYIGTSGGSSHLLYFTGSIGLKQFSITVDGIPVFSGNKTGIFTAKDDDYTTVGTPTITDDGVANFAENSNIDYLTLPNQFKPADKPWEIYIKCKTGSAWNTAPSIFTATGSSNNYASLYFGVPVGHPYFAVSLNLDSTQTSFTNSINTTFAPSLNTEYWFKLAFTGTAYEIWVSNDNGKTYTLNNSQTSSIPFAQNQTAPSCIGTGRAASSAQKWYGSIDLNAFKIYVDGNLVYQPCLKIPYTESKTGSRIVDSVYRSRVNDMAQQFGYANFYTLSDTDFTLPQVEEYGLIGQQTLRKSTVSGINRQFLYSDRTQILTGSCTSGTEVTLPKAFVNSNYALSVPYSAKSATAFTPTQTGDWFAIGEGVL